ncbi:MAG: TRAP transporter small permease subunit [Leptospirales bacterium]|jgi:TRAP-type mannitol/chloroaromatic compound transport system permease small subunit
MNENDNNPVRSAGIRALIARIDAFSESVGRGVAYLVPAMAVVTFLIVVLRYLFNLGWVWMQEAVLYMHAAFFMLAMGYTLHREGHVRVDIFFQDLSPRRKALVDFWGTLLLLYPVCLLLVVFGFGYVLDSWSRLESSPEAGGLPFVFALKSLILCMPLLLALQGTSRMLSAFLALREGAKDD